MRWWHRRAGRLAQAIAVLILAAGLRTWRLAELPPGLHHDEAFHLLRAEEIASGEAFPIYIPDNQGNEPMFAYLAAIGIWLLGPVNWAGRLVASWAGLLSVALTIRAGREMFPGRAAGLWAGLVLAALFWHLDMSRWGSQPILAAAAAAGALAGLWRGARTGQRGAFVLAGVCLAGGLWSYVAFRVFPLVPLAAGLLLLAERPERRRGLVWGGVAAGLTAALLYAPLGLWFVRHPEWFFNRFQQVTQPMLGVEGSLGRLARQATSVAAGLVIPGQGDQIWRHNIAGRPGLDPLQAVLVVLGAAVGLVRRRRAATLTLLVWAAVGLLPAVLTEYPPQHGRSVMATPALALLAGAGVDALGHWRRGQPWARLAGAVAVAVSGGVGAQAYFGRWANDPNLYWAFDVGLYELGRALRAAPAAAALYETPVYREYPTFEFALGAEAYGRFRAFNGRACLVLPEETSGDTYYGVIVAEDVDTLGALRAAYPGGRTVETVGRGTDPYAVVFAIGAGQRPAVSPETARPASFGGLIDLLGYALGPAPASGGTLTLTLYWRMAQHSAAELHVFVHVLGPPRADGSPLYAQRDAGPCDNAYPTWQWAPGEVLVDRMTVEVPADVPAGDYQLGVGWYDSGTLARLQASGPTGEALGDTVVLQPLRLGTP